MYLYIVRHGEPDYVTDTLTEAGRAQAEAVGARLACSGIDAIHASPMGRAVETAEPLSKRLGLPVKIEPWAHEVGEESRTMFPDGVPKSVSYIPAEHLLSEEFRRMNSAEALASVPGLCGSGYAERCRFITEGLDEMLASYGYRRTPEGFYEPVAPNDKHIALFCHCAMTRVLFSHLTNIPIQYVAASFLPHFTNVTLFYFDEAAAAPTQARLISYGDIGHLYPEGSGAQIHQRYGNAF